MSDSPVLIDMDKFFGDRLHGLMIDTIDTCSHGGVPLNQTAMMVMANMWFELSIAAHGTGVTPQQFIESAGIAYRMTGEKLDRIKRMKMK